jgi:hypothetical protein
MSAEQMAKIDRAPDSHKLGVAELPNYEFFINARGVASIREKQGKIVWGILYELSEMDEARLDKKEGIPRFYVKKNLPTLNAFSYIAQPADDGRPREGYLERIIKAAQDNAFPVEYVEELKEWSD